MFPVVHSSTRLWLSLAVTLGTLVAPAAHADVTPTTVAAGVTAQAPDVFVKAITADVFATIKGDKAIQSGDINKVVVVVETKVIPHVNFQRMTATAVGRNWRQASPDQQKRLQDAFKTLLVYTYAGAAAQIKDQTVEFKPMRSRPEDTEVVVRTIVRGKGEPVQLDYRLEKVGDAWKIYDVNVLGAWLVQTYQSSFAQEVNASGIDGLIAKLVERNKQLANKKTTG
ncbi:MAG: ABC transporter substrate-binding protein [Aquabacterium sp.]|nr:ABC transporter substrate-binding protein [Aquabacterium sp.]